MSRRSSSNLYLLSVIIIGLSLSSPLYCEEAEEGLATAEAKSSKALRSRVLEEVLVTATKRETDLRDIPLSIDAFSGDALREIGVENVEGIARFSPGVSVSPGLDPEAAQIIIRGVSTDTFFTFFTRTFGMFYEDISLVNPSILGPQPNIDPFDLRSVEILKGPQGTLFGGSALSGAVRYVPNHPDYEQAYGKVAAAVGTLEGSDGKSHRYDVMWNQPLNDKLAMRFAVSTGDRPGYVKDLRSGEDDINTTDSQQYRGIVSWQASEKLEFRLNALRRETHQDDGSFADNDQEATHSNRYFPDILDSRTDIVILTSEYGFEFADLSLILSQLDKDYPQRLDYSQFFGTSQAGIGAYGDTTIYSSQPSAELRLVSAEATQSDWWIFKDWDYVLGLFYIESDQFLSLDIGTQETGNLLQLKGDVYAEEKALFFDIKRSFGEHWELGFGGRYFEQSTTADISTTADPVSGLAGANPLVAALAPVINALPIESGIGLGRDQGEISETVFNPKFTVQWRYSDEFSVFGSIVKGFRYAGANQNPSRDPDVPLFFESDEIWNYELGVRTEWFEGALQLDATVFQLEWTDMQVQQREYTGAFAYTDNVGGARNRGFELGMNMLLPAGFYLKLNGSYVDAQTTTFFDDFQGPAPAGTELPGSPPVSGSALLLWAYPFSEGQFSATLSYTYQNRNYNNLAQTYKHPPLALVGASANLSMTNWPGAPVFSLIGANLTNEFKPAVVFDTPNSGGILTIFNPPRTVRLGVEFTIGDI
ncbi:TonB-dependent receptor [Zhongshania guokunii]|uniref:TonB-dependent receptor n=1 Tax=Zhongshania guokunii TaxID=641783 RepID=A0ABV3U6P3_9GAMM